MVKFKITPERITECCNIMELGLMMAGNRDTFIKVSPRFVLDNDGEYIVKPILDEDTDIKELQNLPDAFQKMAGVTPKRFEKLMDEFMEAVKGIVNPPSARD